MKKLVCKVCKKEYYRSEKEAAKDTGCCSSLCESRALLMACRAQCGGENMKKDK